MKINWLVRIKNPLFWAQVLISIVLPILTYFGVDFNSLTTWPMLWETFVKAVSNPVVVVSMVVSVWHCVTDPTTKGFGDSQTVLNKLKNVDTNPQK